MSPNPYLQKLHALRAKKDTPHELTKLTKPRNGGSEGTKVGSVSFVSTQGIGFFDPEACNKSMPQEAKNTLSGHRQNRQNPYGCTLAALQARCPDVVPVARWQQAIEDGRSFLAGWGEQAEALGWTPATCSASTGRLQTAARPRGPWARGGGGGGGGGEEAATVFNGLLPAGGRDDIGAAGRRAARVQP